MGRARFTAIASAVSRTIAVAIMAGCALTARAAPTADTGGEAEQAALRVVRIFGNQQYIDSRVVRAAQTTRIYEVLVRQLGYERAQQILTGAVASAMPKYLPELDQLQAAGLARTIPVDQLSSLATAGRNSPYVGELRSRSAAVQRSVRWERNELERRIATDLVRSLDASLRAENPTSAPETAIVSRRGQSASFQSREGR